MLNCCVTETNEALFASRISTTTGMAASPMKSRPNFSQAIRRNSIGCRRATTNPIKDALCDAGFIDLRIAVLTREKQVSDIGAFAHAMVYGNPLIDMIRTRSGVDPDQVVNALGEAFAREFGNPGRLPQRAILFEATRP